MIEHVIDNENIGWEEDVEEDLEGYDLKSVDHTPK